MCFFLSTRRVFFEGKKKPQSGWDWSCANHCWKSLVHCLSRRFASRATGDVEGITEVDPHCRQAVCRELMRQIE
jgi:hypothetical protein